MFVNPVNLEKETSEKLSDRQLEISVWILAKSDWRRSRVSSIKTGRVPEDCIVDVDGEGQGERGFLNNIIISALKIVS